MPPPDGPLPPTLGLDMVELVVFFAQLLGMFLLVLGVPTALFCFLGTLTYRDLKTFKKLLLAVCIWLSVMSLYVWVVPNGELSSRQYSGLAGLMQIVFFVANAAFFRFSVRILRWQTNARKQ